MRRIRGAPTGLGLLLVVALTALSAAQELVPLPPVDDSELSLVRASELAMLNNPSIRDARANIDDAQGQAVQAGLYPNLRFDSGNPNQIGGMNTQFSPGFTQHFVRGGKLRLSKAAAEDAVRQATLAYVRQRYEVITDVRQQFYQVLSLQERVRVLKNLVELADQSLNISQKLLDSGQGTLTDKLLLRVELRKNQVALRTAELSLAAAKQQLAALLGTPEMRIDRVVGVLNAQLPTWTDEDARATLLARNAELQSRRIEIDRTRLLLRRAEAEPTPDWDVTGGWQYNPYNNNGSNPAYMGVFFDLPIWNRNQGGIRSANANVNQAAAQLSAAQNDLLRQLADALARYRSAQQVVETFETSILPDSQQTLQLVRQGYKEGQFDLVRLLEAQRGIVEANLEYIDALYNRLNAAADVANWLQLDYFP
jgi:cobalt-zinc-cadmium efflux system outer membrane protein